jgi:hypothetical protein
MVTITGAYGRTYDSIISAKADWDDNKDFQIIGGPYINRTDWQEYRESETVAFQSSTATWILQEVVVSRMGNFTKRGLKNGSSN